MKKTIYAFIGLILIGISYFIFSWNSIHNDDIAPDFEAKLIDGSAFNLKDLRGQYILLDFWGSWCPPCRRENRTLVKFHKKNKSKITIVSIALEKNHKSGLLAAQLDGLKWKHQIVEEHAVVLQSKIARLYGVSNIPAKFLIKPNGQIMKDLNLGQIDSIINK